MPLKRCTPCSGSGKVMGGGMVFNDCEACYGRGKTEVADDEMDYLLAKNTEGYAKAKQNIMALDKDITDQKAEELLDAELAKPANVANPVDKRTKAYKESVKKERSA